MLEVQILSNNTVSEKIIKFVNYRVLNYKFNIFPKFQWIELINRFDFFLFSFIYLEHFLTYIFLNRTYFEKGIFKSFSYTHKTILIVNFMIFSFFVYSLHSIFCYLYFSLYYNNINYQKIRNFYPSKLLCLIFINLIVMTEFFMIFMRFSWSFLV